MVNVHVNIARPDRVMLVRMECDCTERDSRKIHPRILVEHYPWYGFQFTCMRCGEIYTEEGRAERPFMRGWRERNKFRARDRMMGYWKDLKAGRCLKNPKAIEVMYPDSEADFLERAREKARQGKSPG